MKKLLPVLVLFISFYGFSQDAKRIIASGQIIVEGSDIQGITIYNTNSKFGTITDENGEFTIAVSLNDLLEIRAVEYQNFDVRVNRTIMDSKEIHIFLIEEVNKLDEVVITTKGLSGDLESDIKGAATFNLRMDDLYFGIKNYDSAGSMADNSNPLVNPGMDTQGQGLVNGLNVKNVVDQLLIPLFRSEVVDKKAAGVPEVPANSIKYFLGSNLLVENFNIPEHRVEEFIRYVEDENFNYDLLNYGNEIELLQLLDKKSKSFLAKNGSKD